MIDNDTIISETEGREREGRRKERKRKKREDQIAKQILWHFFSSSPPSPFRVLFTMQRNTPLPSPSQDTHGAVAGKEPWFCSFRFLLLFLCLYFLLQ